MVLGRRWIQQTQLFPGTGGPGWTHRLQIFKRYVDFTYSIRELAPIQLDNISDAVDVDIEPASYLNVVDAFFKQSSGQELGSIQHAIAQFVYSASLNVFSPKSWECLVLPLTQHQYRLHWNLLQTYKYPAVWCKDSYRISVASKSFYVFTVFAGVILVWNLAVLWGSKLKVWR